jgi:hypothetical protein
MDRFKKRYGFREFQQHSKAESVNTVEVGRVMDIICDLIKDYHPQDIFNMDETGLF